MYVISKIINSFLFGCLSLCNYQAFSYNTPKEAKSFETTSACASDDSTYNSSSIDSFSYISDGNNLTLNLSLNNDEAFVSATSDSLEINSITEKQNSVSVFLSVTNQFSSLKIGLTNNMLDPEPTNGSQAASDSELGPNEISYYVYKNCESIFVSSVSLDQAIESSGDDPALINNPITIINPNPTTPNVPLNTYRGTLAWKDRNGNEYPLVGAAVSITHSPSGARLPIISVVYTNENGYFDTGVIRGTATESTFCVKPANQNIRLLNCDTSTENTTIGIMNRTSPYSFPLTDYITSLCNGSTLVFDSTKNINGSDYCAAFQIFQALYYYSEYAETLDSDNLLTRCNAIYPCDKDYDESTFQNIDSAKYKTGISSICIPPSNTIPVGIYSYESWDLIGHEYGHHIGTVFNCCHVSGGYYHTAVVDDIYTLCDRYSYNSQQWCINTGLCLSWSESWPTYWAEIAQHTFPQSILTNYANGYVGDEIYEAYNYLSTSSFYDLAHCEDRVSNNSSTASGESCEAAITRFLYELNRKAGSYGENDKPATDYLWQYILDCGDQFNNNYSRGETFSDVYNYLYEETQLDDFNAFDINDLSDLTCSYGISPLSVHVLDDVDLIKWTTGGEYYLTPYHGKTYLGIFDQYGKRRGMCLLNEEESDEHDTRMYTNRYAPISQSNLNTLVNAVSGSTVSLALMVSTRYYSNESEQDPIQMFTGPYATIIFSGSKNDLTLDTLRRLYPEN